MSSLIDTTEMYLKTIYELEEDGVTPLRARIVERLDHSGPTVSQTVARMERDGLVRVRGDRRLELTDEGRAVAVQVMRRHRLAERLLLDIIGMDWVSVHDEACRWEHVMSEAVEERLSQILVDPETDPYGNPVPGAPAAMPGTPLDAVDADGPVEVEVIRIGEPIQAETALLGELDSIGIRPHVRVLATPEDGVHKITIPGNGLGVTGETAIPSRLAPHFFVQV